MLGSEAVKVTVLLALEFARHTEAPERLKLGAVFTVTKAVVVLVGQGLELLIVKVNVFTPGVDQLTVWGPAVLVAKVVETQPSQFQLKTEPAAGEPLIESVVVKLFEALLSQTALGEALMAPAQKLPPPSALASAK